MDNIHNLDTHRDAKTQRSQNDQTPNRLLADARIRRITNPPIRMTVAHMLNELGVDPRTLQLNGSKNMSSYTIHKSLIDSHCASMDDYLLQLGTAMYRITGIRPEHLAFSLNQKTKVVTVAYVR